MKAKGVLIRDAQILWALRSLSANGDIESAHALLLAMSDASEGMVQKLRPAYKNARRPEPTKCDLLSRRDSILHVLSTREF